MDAKRNRLRSTWNRSITRSNRKHSQKHADILRRQNRLIQDNRPLGDLETIVDATQNILPLSDEHILISLQARAVDDEVRMNLDFVAVVFLDSNVGNHMPRARRRYFGPGILGVGAFDSDLEALLVVVEVVSFAGLRQLVADVFRPFERVMADRHPVTDIVSKQV